MELNRRNLLGGFAALIAAPAIVRSELLMPVRDRTLILYGDGITDDTKAFQALINGDPVWHLGKILRRAGDRIHIPLGSFRFTDTMNLTRGGVHIDRSHFLDTAIWRAM